MLKIIFPNPNVVLTNSEQKIINYILQSPSDFLLMPIKNLSLRLGVSEATISRFSKHIGYADYKELKADIFSQLNSTESPADKLSQSMAQHDFTTVRSMFLHQQHCLQKTMEYIDEENVNKITEAITKASKIYIYGKSATSSLALQLKFRLKRFGFQIELLPSGGSEIFEALNFITPTDFVIIFGFQNISSEAQVIFDLRSKIGFQTLLISSRLANAPNSSSDYYLYVYRGEPTEYHSMCAPTALIDALVIKIATTLDIKATQSLDRLHQLKEAYKREIPR